MLPKVRTDGNRKMGERYQVNNFNNNVQNTPDIF